MPEITDERLWHLHGVAVGMMERQVDRGWAATQFFLLLGVSIVGGAFALLHDSGVVERALASVAFLAGAAVSLIGSRVLLTNKVYYRRLVAKKTLLEERLGLLAPWPGREGSAVATLSVGPLATSDKARTILDNPDGYASGPLRPGSATDWAQWTLLVLATVDLLAASATILWTRVS